MKNKLIIAALLLVVFVAGCGSKSNLGDQGANDESQMETNAEDENPEEQVEKEEDKDNAKESDKTDKEEEKDSEYTIDDFFAADSDVEYIYEGDGGEFSSYKEYIDFFNDNRKQVREVNGGTEVVYVIEKTETELKKIYEMAEVYYKENFLSKDPNINKTILKSPIVVGTKWDNKEYGKSEITAIDTEVETGFGTLKAVEVTTLNTLDGKETVLKEYFAKNVGLVKSVYKDDLYEVNVILNEINENKIFKSTLNFYYPNGNADRIFLYKKELDFKTNDIPRKLIEELYKEYPNDVGPVLTKNSKINHLYLNNDGRAYIDLSKEFVNEMNAGSGVEAMILQSLANTVGDYFGVSKVMLTIENEPYESGHILLEKFEAIEVNYDGIVDKN
ncbi:MAG: hypothetical protein GX752_03550 [Clostridium sp.]|nr:hypothetical protein [Clostridium sp.]